MPRVNIEGVGVVNFPSNMSPEDITKAIEQDILPKARAAEPEPDSSDLVRGFTSYLPQTKETIGGAQVLAGKALGSEDMIRSGIERMNAAKAELATKHKATDSFTNALDKGVGAVLTDWLPYQIGSGAANLVESLGVMLAGSAVGSMVAPGVGTVAGGATGLVEKELVKRGIKEAAEKIAKDQGEEAAKNYFEQQTKAVVKDIAKGAAAKTALAAQAGVHGAGEVTSRAVEEAERLGKDAADIDMERVLPSALVHGVAEYFGDKIGLGAWKNISNDAKTGLLNLGKSLLTNTAITGTKEAPVEVIQSAAERFGAKMSLADAEAVKEYIDSAAAAYGMSVMPAAGGTLRSYAEAMGREDARLAQEAMRQRETEQLTAKAQEEAAQIGTTAVPDASGVVPPATVQADIQFAQMQPGAIGAGTPSALPSQQLDEFAGLESKATPELPKRPPAKVKNETPQEEFFRYQEMLRLGIDHEGKELNANYRTSIKNKLIKKFGYDPEAADVTKPAGTDAAAAESGAASPASELGTPTRRAEAPTPAGVVPTGGPATTTTVAEGAQPTTLEGAPSVTQTTKAKQAEEKRSEEAAPAERVVLTPEQLKKGYNLLKDQYGEDLPAWKDLTEDLRKSLIPDIEAALKTKGMLPSKAEAPVPTRTDLKRAQLKQHTAIVNSYNENRPGRLRQWSELTRDEQDVYLSQIRTNTAEDQDRAYNTLYNYLKSSEKIAQEETAEEAVPVGASIYELNRQAYSSALPRWGELDDDARKLFLKAVTPGIQFNEKGEEVSRKVTQEQMDTGFADVWIHNLDKEARAPKEEKGKAQRIAREELEASKQEVEVGEKLESGVKEKKGAPTFEPFSSPPLPESAAELRKLLKDMVHKGSAINTKLVEELLSENTNAGVLAALARGDVNGALQAMQQAKGMRLTEFGGYRFEGLELFETRYRAISQALFRHLAKTLNKINFASSEVVLEGLDPNNAIIAQLKREGKLAAYDPKTDTFYFTNDGLDEQTVLHEIVHAGTVKTLYAYKTNPNSLTQEEREAAEHIDRIYEFAKKRLGDKPRYKNAFENVFEFVSYALTDPTFQGELASMQAPSLNKYMKATPGLNLNNLWSQFTKAMMALYNLFKPKATRLQIKDELYPGLSKEFYAVQLKSDKIKLQSPQALAKIYKNSSKNKIKDESSHPWDGWFPSKGIAEVAPTQLMSKQAGYESNVLLEFTEAFKNILAEPEAGIDLEALPAKKPKQPKPAKQAPAEGKADFEAMLDAMPSQTGNVRQAVRKMNWTKASESLVKLFQNDRAAIKNWQNRLRYTGRLIAYATGFNNIYDQLTLSSGNAFHLYTEYAQSSSDALRQEILAYAKKYDMDVDRAVKELGLFAIALHEPERRRTLYLRTVPLEGGSTDPKKPGVPTLVDAKGNPITADAARNAIFAYLDSHKLDESGAKYLRAQLDAIVNDKANHDKSAAAEKFDINNQAYAVAGYTTEQIEAARKAYEARKSDVEPIIHNMKKLNKVVLDLNEMANYMSEYAKNYIMFYGFENYVPFKGKTFIEDKADLFNYDTRKIGGELQERQHTFEGRISVPESPVLQVMSDAAQAALRAGRRDVTQAIYNAVKEKTLAGKIMMFKDEKGVERDYVSFQDRKNDDLMDKLKGETKVFHYMPDGKVAIIQIDDEQQRDAIRRTYREVNPLTDWLVSKGNLLTGVVGQMHTRYNLAFAPVNFVRDVLTNSFTLGAELGPKATFQYIGAVASDVATGNLYKTGNFARLYANGNVTAIEALAKKDNYYRDLLDYIKIGGKVSYIQGIAPKGQYNELFKGVGGNVILRTKEQVDKFFDMYIDTFELSARVSAYRITKATETARLKKEDPTKSDAEIEQAASKTAAAYAKNLANFEQVGQYGRALGAFFMFFRPSATGAVRALEALAPLTQSVERAKLGLPEFAEAAQIREKLAKGVSEAEQKKLKEKLAKLDKAITTFEQNYAERRKNAKAVTTVLFGIGAIAYAMSYMMADDDDLGRNKLSTDDTSRWTRYARFFIPGTNTVFQLPWGYGLGAFAAAGAQAASMFNGNVRMADTLGNLVTISLDSFLPLPVSRIPPLEKPLQFAIDSMVPSIARPIVEYVMNVDALGRQIYNNRQSRFGEAYTGGDNIPELYKDAAIYLLETTGINMSPNILYFFANNYADGASRILHNANNTRLWLSGKKDFEAKTDLMVLDSFFGRESNFDARQWQRIENDLKERANYVKMLKDNNPVLYAEYLSKNPIDGYLIDRFNKDVNGTLRDLRAEANRLRAMQGIDPKTRTDLVKNIVLQENLEKRRLINTYEALGVKP